jgi:cell division protein ZapA (FtsZ GTPase activity inhibitor)
VAFLGRWKSNVILGYAQEALESMAVNGDKKFGGAPLQQPTQQVDKEISELVLQAQSQVPKDPEVKMAVVQQIQTELAKLKANTKDASENLQREIRGLESKWESNSTFLPNLVKAARHQVIHKNGMILALLQFELRVCLRR